MSFILICLAVLAAGPATALSCLRPDAVRLFEQARDAKETFHIVKGRVTLLETPNLPDPNQKKPAMTLARVDGAALSKSGFHATFSEGVLLEVPCLGPWCGDPDGLEGELIMAIEVSGDTRILRLGPCGGDQVQWDQVAEDRILTCYLDGDCKQEF